VNREASKLPSAPAKGAMHNSAKRSVRVLTVDDQQVFRRVAHDVIEATAGFDPVAEASSGEQALELAAGLDPDLILVDVRMPGMDGLETSRRLSESQPSAIIVLITIEDPEEVSSSPAECGADALVRKQEFSPAKLRALWREHGVRQDPEAS
jgi:two-component system, NarL family, invasion response regulator UvrY